MKIQEVVWNSQDCSLKDTQQRFYLPKCRSVPVAISQWANPTSGSSAELAKESARNRFADAAQYASAQAYEIIAVPTFALEWEFELPTTYTAYAVGLFYGDSVHVNKTSGSFLKRYELPSQLLFDPQQHRLQYTNGTAFEGRRIARIKKSLILHEKWGAEVEELLQRQLINDGLRQGAKGIEILASMAQATTRKEEDSKYQIELVALLYT